MTTEQPIDQPAGQPEMAFPRDQPIGIHHLRRRTSDRVIGGVAGGLGDYLNVDPILLRAAFAGLMIFGGAGLVLYVLGWLLIPAADRDESIAQAALQRLASRLGRTGGVILVIIAVVVLSPWLFNRFDSFYVPPEMFWALAVALIGVFLLLPRDQRAGAGRVGYSAASGLGTGAAGANAGPAGAYADPAISMPAARAARPRERSPLGWFILAGTLVAMGVLAVVDTASAVRVVPGQYFGAGFLALGVGLIVGAWWGRARLIGLLGLLILPLAAASAFVTVPLEGGFGDRDYQPQGIAEVQPAYHLVGGQLRLDLSHLGKGASPVSLEATVGVGDLYVVVPKDATVKVSGTVQGGQLWLFGREQVGTGLADRVSEPGSATGGTLVLTLEAGLGRIWIERSTLEGN